MLSSAVRYHSPFKAARQSSDRAAASRRSQPHDELAKPTALSKLVSDREVLIRHVANWRFAVVTLAVQVFNVAVDVLLAPMKLLV